ncbi:MAG: DUF5056 domain-containing protein [Prevotella sp.]|nr:DUF5056 domain-containing protein [Prevotella sp.]
MTDKDNIMLEEFFKQAAQQQIEDRGFTERVMKNLPDRKIEIARKLSCLWTIFCIVIGVALFFLLGGWQSVTSTMASAIQMVMTALEVFIITAPTAEISVNPWVVLLMAAFVLVFLPYQTYRRLSATL